MPDFGSPVAQNVQTPSFTTTLGGLMDLKAKQQQLQVGQNNAQAAQQTMQERQRITGMMSSGVDDQGNSIRGTDGQPDPAKILPALGRMAPLTGQQYAQSVLATHTAKIGLQSASLGLDSKQREAVMGPLQAVAANPNDPELVGHVGTALDSWATAHPEMSGLVNNVKTTLLPHIVNAQPDQRAKMANSMAALLQGGQKVETQPSGASVSNGQTTQIGATAPPVAGGGFAPAAGPASTVQQQPSPTTQVMGPGAQPQLYGARPPLTPNSAPVASGLAPGVAEGITGPVATNNQHFSTVQADAQGAPNRIAALQTIKQEAPAAATGGGDWRRKVLSQWSGLFPSLYTGPGSGNETQTATDVMAKNLAVLAAQGGNTDAARALGEMANPSYHMTEEAVRKTSDQLIGIEAKKQAAQSYFTGTPTNSPLYAQKLTQWNQNADPRAFEYANKAPADQAAMRAEMKKAGTWDALRRKMVGLHDMGIGPQ